MKSNKEIKDQISNLNALADSCKKRELEWVYRNDSHMVKLEIFRRAEYKAMISALEWVIGGGVK